MKHYDHNEEREETSRIDAPGGIPGEDDPDTLPFGEAHCYGPECRRDDDLNCSCQCESCDPWDPR